ncbi:hypothetical protein ACWEQ2_36825 [Streptomyces sp. NPDC004096]
MPPEPDGARLDRTKRALRAIARKARPAVIVLQLVYYAIRVGREL